MLISMMVVKTSAAADSETRVPQIRRDRMQRPRWSVPRGYCAPDGASLWASTTLSGSLGARYGANTPTATAAAMMPRPSRASLSLASLFRAGAITPSPVSDTLSGQSQTFFRLKSCKQSLTAVFPFPGGCAGQ
ncbi:MAG: hypothetical protein K6T66_02385 [Peptococcaceae bacterium]|nr:hypothetical protein [Peptococcaceae bacterium]